MAYHVMTGYRTPGWPVPPPATSYASSPILAHELAKGKRLSPTGSPSNPP